MNRRLPSPACLVDPKGDVQLALSNSAVATLARAWSYTGIPHRRRQWLPFVGRVSYCRQLLNVDLLNVDLLNVDLLNVDPVDRDLKWSWSLVAQQDADRLYLRGIQTHAGNRSPE